MDSWVQMQSQMQKPTTFDKMERQTVFHNQQTKAFKELFVLHIKLFE
jgi:hypothetical protein